VAPRKYLNKIAKYNGIGAETVTSIHQAARINDIPDGDLMRDLALMLKKEGHSEIFLLCIYGFTKRVL
jgi:hypothetical protein